MMKFLVTADIHLSENHKKRFEIFRWLFHKAHKEEVDGMLIGGDLFDSNKDLGFVKNDLISLLEEKPLPVITIPGNHDSNLSSESSLGNNLVVLDQANQQVKIQKGQDSLAVKGVPYRKGEKGIPDGEMPPSNSSGASIFLGHGSLIVPQREEIFQGTLNQDEENDHLFFSRDFHDLDYDCIIIGHWHGFSQFSHEDTQFLCPGSPLPVSKNEIGKKFYWTLTVSSEEGFQTTKHPIKADCCWYYRKMAVFVIPTREDESINRFRNLLEGADDDTRCYILFEIKGLVHTDRELNLKKELEEIAADFSAKFHDINLAWNLSTIEKLDSPLMSKFIDRVEKIEKEDLSPSDFLDPEERTYSDQFEEAIENRFEEIKGKILTEGLESFFDRLL